MPPDDNAVSQERDTASQVSRLGRHPVRFFKEARGAERWFVSDSFWRVLCWLTLGGGLGVIVWKLLYALKPDEPALAEPVAPPKSWIDILYGDVWLVGAMRTLMVFAGVVLLVALTYIAVSFTRRMWRGQFITRLWGLEISNDALQEHEALKKVKKRLAETTALIETYKAQLEEWERAAPGE